jgi:two-component system, chemotaxis family, protein-glutamate methylesterase/glutaminase
LEKDSLKSRFEMLIIGGSAGSLEVLLSGLSQVHEPMNISIVVVLHRKPSPDYSLANLFSYKTRIPVREIEDKEPIVPGTIYIAPADYHLLVEEERVFSLDVSEKIHFSRPSIDVAFESAAEIYHEKLAALLLSGANADGVEGMRIVQKLGGLIAVQDPKTASVPVMPGQAMARLKVDKVVEGKELAEFIRFILNA